MAPLVTMLVLAAWAVPSYAALVARAGLGKERPVMKVVRLLQDMQAELQHELEDDRAVNEKLDCWCKSNDREKTKAIELGEALAAQLESTIGASAAKVKELTQKRKAALDEVFADQKALGEATALRMKANKAFHGEEADLIEAVKATKQAIVVLSKHHPELAQLRSAAERLHAAQVPKLARAGGSLRQDQLAALQSFLRQASQASSFLAIPGFQSYSSQSGQIYGILQQMSQDFEHSLEQAQAAEKKAADEYAALKAAKEEEITTGQNTVVDLDASIAEFGQKKSQAEKQLADTQEQLGLDRTFLANLRQQCAESQAEFDARVKSRSDEIAAVQEAIQILNSEDSFNLFNSAVLLQTGVSSTALEEQTQLRSRAAAVLQSAARHTGAAQLSVLAASARLDTFEKVKEAVDKLVAEMAKQQKDDVSHRDWCIDEFASNDRATAAADDKKEGLRTKIADLDKTIDSLTAEIGNAQAAMAELQEQMKRASETREAQNADFQQTAVDQHLTQEILTKALKRLQQVYAFVQQHEPKGPGAPHIQTSGDHTDPGNGPARFTKYEQNAGGSRATKLLEQIIADSKLTEAEAMRSEVDSQTAYENFIKDSNKILIAQTKAVSDMVGARAQAEESLVLSKSELKQTVLDLENLHLTLGDLHGNCDFIMKNFSARQEARSAEMEALGQAKAILSGMH